MLKKYKKFLINALLIILIIVSVKYINLLREYNREHTLANRSFTSCLSVSYSFGSNLVSSEKFNDYYYNDAMAKSNQQHIYTNSQHITMISYRGHYPF